MSSRKHGSWKGVSPSHSPLAICPLGLPEFEALENYIAACSISAIRIFVRLLIKCAMGWNMCSQCIFKLPATTGKHLRQLKEVGQRPGRRRRGPQRTTCGRAGKSQRVAEATLMAAREEASAAGQRASAKSGDIEHLGGKKLKIPYRQVEHSPLQLPETQYGTRKTQAATPFATDSPRKARRLTSASHLCGGIAVTAGRAARRRGPGTPTPAHAIDLRFGPFPRSTENAPS